MLGAAGLPPSHHPVHRAPIDLLTRIAASNPATLRHDDPPLRPLKVGGLRVNPAQLGGDPTGRSDSWAALNAALHVCLNQSSLSPNGFFPGQDTQPAFGPIRDMGGCHIDLAGGEYLISQPLVIPEMTANMQLGDGSLVAGPGFPEGDFLIVVGVKGSCKFPQGSCNIDLNFPELFLDGAKRASGMEINNVMGVTIGPGGYFLNFTNYGVQINAGHEVMMDRVWLGETNFDFDHVGLGAPPNATAIQINGNDHYILNTIIFSAKVGLEVNGGADYVTGVHVWFPLNAATAFADSMAFHINGSCNRFMGCYIDGGRAIFEAGATAKNIWQQGYECCQGSKEAPGTTRSGITLLGDKMEPGLQIVNNIFGGGSIFHRSKMWPTAARAARAGTDTMTMEGRDVHDDAEDDRDCPQRLNMSMSGVGCVGLERASSGDASSKACEAACCADSGCSAWQWCKDDASCDGATAGDGAQCWTGSASDCVGHGARRGWVGRGAQPPSSGSSNVTVTGVRIMDNVFTQGPVGTRAVLSVSSPAGGKPTSSFHFDFCDQLLFPTIATARVHVVASSGFPVAVARPTRDCTLKVETSEPMVGTITVEVDSSEPSSQVSLR